MTISTSDLITALIEILVPMLLMFLAGGITVLVILNTLLDNIAKSPVIIAYLKHLADSASPELLHALTDVREIADETLPDGGKKNAAG